MGPPGGILVGLGLAGWSVWRAVRPTSVPTFNINLQHLDLTYPDATSGFLGPDAFRTLALGLIVAVMAGRRARRA